MRKLLSGWLQLVDKRRFDCELEPHRLRLAAMAACATTSVRRQKESLPSSRGSCSRDPTASYLRCGRAGSLVSAMSRLFVWILNAATAACHRG